MNEPEMTKNNPSIQNPYRYLDLDAAHVNPFMAVNLYLEVTNALVYFTSLSKLNRDRLDDIEGRTSPEYKAAQKERHGLDHQIEALKLKHDALEQVLYMKSAEMRHIDKTRHII